MNRAQALEVIAASKLTLDAVESALRDTPDTEEIDAGISVAIESAANVLTAVKVEPEVKS